LTEEKKSFFVVLVLLILFLKFVICGELRKINGCQGHTNVQEVKLES